MIRQFLGPLRRRLLLVFFIVLAVPTAFGILAAVDHYKGQVEQARRSTERYATLASNNETNLLWQSQRIVDDLAHDPVIRDVIAGTGNAGECEATLKKAIDPTPLTRPHRYLPPMAMPCAARPAVLPRATPQTRTGSSRPYPPPARC